MMRKALLALACAGSLALAGCVTDGTGSTTDPAQNIQQVVAEVQSATIAACGFLPTAQTVAGIVATFTGTSAVVASLSSVATMICSAVTTPAAKRGGPKVRGVAVRGRFVH